MAIRQFEKDLNIISALADEPNAEDGLSAAGLKAKFDEGGNAVKEYINGSLIPDVNAEISGSIAAALLKNGNMPQGGTAGQVLVKQSAADYHAEFRNMTELVSAGTVPLTGNVAALLGFPGGTNVETSVGNLLGRTVFHGNSSTAAATAAKTVTISGISGTVAVNTTVAVSFTNTNTAANPTLNVSGTGAKPIWYAGETLPFASLLRAGIPYIFVYDGTNWRLANPSVTCVSGTFTTGATANAAVTVTLGFRPRLVVITGPANTSFGGKVFPVFIFIVPPGVNSVEAPSLNYGVSSTGSIPKTLTITNTGFSFPTMGEWTGWLNAAFSYFAV